MWLAAAVNAGANYRSNAYSLAADIDLSGQGSGAVFNNGKGWIPIGNYDGSLSTAFFNGVFDGNKHKISGLFMDDNTVLHAGLFGVSGTIRNLGVTGINIAGYGQFTGGIVARDAGGISITNCYATGSVAYKGTNTNAYVGGIVGYVSAAGNVSNCYSSANVSGVNYVGGIVGQFYSGTSVSYCYSTGEVRGTDYVGGIIGGYYSGTATGAIRNCAALNPRIVATGTNMGRIVGYAPATAALAGNRAWSSMYNGTGTSTTWSNKGAAAKDGADMTNANAFAGNFWSSVAIGSWDTAAWSDTVWTFENYRLPVIKNAGGAQSGIAYERMNLSVISYGAVAAPTSYAYTGLLVYPTNISLNSLSLSKADYTIQIVDGGINAGTVTAMVTIHNSNLTNTTVPRVITYTISKATGATVSAPAFSSKTSTTVTLNAVSAPSNGQTVEYARNTSSSVPSSGWQAGTTFTGLSTGTTYYFFARAAANDNYNAGTASAGLQYALNKDTGAAVSAPTLLSKTTDSITVNPVSAPSNGQGVEYARNTSSSAPSSGWQSGTTFTGLTANTTYYIFARSVSNNDYNAGVASAGLQVTTDAVVTPVYSITVDGGTASVTSAAAGTQITLTAGTPSSGMRFKEWKALVGGVTITANNTFTMPAGDVVVQAVFEEIPVTPTYTITVDGGTASVTSAAAGTQITLTVGTVPGGMQFKEWKVIVGGVTVTANNTFTMPAGDVVVQAVFEEIPVTPMHTITVDGGTVSAASAAAGTQITLTPTVPGGMQFKEWKVIVGGVTVTANNTFTMPAGDVVVQAVFEEIPVTPVYSITVDGGAADITSAEAGTQITLTVGTVPGGMQFKEWKVIVGGVTVTANNTFTMPAGDVVIQAVYEEIPVTPIYSITVDGGAASVTSAEAGTQITLTAGTPSAGMRFKEWKVIVGGVTVTANNTFTMPAGDVVIQAVCEAIPDSKVKSSQSGVPVISVEKTGADFIILTAVAGAEYSKDNGATWQDGNGFTNLTAGTDYTFIARMKGTDSLLSGNNSQGVTATPQAETAPGKGLSGGAVAGIAVGCVAGTAAICFLLYWFVLRKK